MHKRVLSLTMCSVLLFVTIVGRVAFITASNTYQVADTYNSYSLTIDTLTPTIYFANGSKLTNNKTSLVAIIKPTEKAYAEINLLFDKQQSSQVYQRLLKGFPIVEPIDSYVAVNYTKIMEIKCTLNTCSQMISRQSSGLLTYLPLKVGELKINFSADANGRVLAGDNGTLVNDNYDSKQGVKLYIDNNIQNIVYNACSNLDNGCVIVLDVDTGNVLASVTKPDSSYINKPLTQYAVGSIFKIIIASCALENNTNLVYNCNGSITVGDTTFNCQNQKSHSIQNIKQALANSCNCYFVNLALHLGKDKLLKTINDFGFNDTTTLYDNWNINNANVPTDADLSQKGQLALLGFGQGKLTATPIQMARCLCAVANGGNLPTVSLVKSNIGDNGVETQLPISTSKKIMSSENANMLLNYLKYVVTDGTGANANDKNNNSAGKTATAQTGQYKNGKELLNTWFAGVYPADNPKYAIVVMCEQGSSGSKDCCPIYRTIVENL